MGSACLTVPIETQSPLDKGQQSEMEIDDVDAVSSPASRAVLVI